MTRPPKWPCPAPAMQADSGWSTRAMPEDGGWLARAAGQVRRAAAAWSAPPIARAVRAENLTYLDLAALAELHRAVADRANVPGDLVEVGCALGGSALVMAHARTPPSTGCHPVRDRRPSVSASTPARCTAAAGQG